MRRIVFAVWQGWTKFYEFGWSDLRSSAEIIDGLYARAGIICLCERNHLAFSDHSRSVSPICASYVTYTARIVEVAEIETRYIFLQEQRTHFSV